MGEWAFVNEWWFAYLVLPALIICARIADVSLDTMRIIFLNRGRKVLAQILVFFEVLIWIVAVSQVMKNLANPICYLAYGLGFASGNYIGMVGSMTAMTSIYAVTTHSTLSTVTPNDAMIFGRPTLTMVASRTAMKVPIMMFPSTHHRYDSC